MDEDPGAERRSNWPKSQLLTVEELGSGRICVQSLCRTHYNLLPCKAGTSLYKPLQAKFSSQSVCTGRGAVRSRALSAEEMGWLRALRCGCSQRYWPPLEGLPLQEASHALSLCLWYGHRLGSQAPGQRPHLLFHQEEGRGSGVWAWEAALVAELLVIEKLEEPEPILGGQCPHPRCRGGGSAASGL